MFASTFTFTQARKGFDLPKELKALCSEIGPEDSKQPSGTDVTLVTQLSIGRLSLLTEMLNAWQGPISIALYLRDGDIPYVESFMSNSQILGARDDFALHLVFSSGSTLYPVNYLRNVALEVSNSNVIMTWIQT